jgi:hypothetical protein
MGEMRLPDVKVIEVVTPPIYDYPQGLEEVPAKGLYVPITCAMIMTLWGQKRVRIHEMCSNAARMTMQAGELVRRSAKLTRRGQRIDAHRTIFRQVMELFD